jgi:hypothetical protein
MPANRNRSQPRAPFKPATFATAAQLDQLAEGLRGVLTAFEARLAITETALGSVINDLYARTEPNDEDCGCEDCDESADEITADELQAEYDAEAERMVSEGGPVFDD